MDDRNSVDHSKSTVQIPSTASVSQPVYLVIELRNNSGDRVGIGGQNITVQHTSKRVRIFLTPLDNGDGSYFLELTPEDGGNNMIEVKVDGKNIKGSPFTLSVTEVRPTGTRPVAHWYYLDSQLRKHLPYSDSDNEQIEEHFKKFSGGIVPIREFKIDLSKREEVNTAQKHLLVGGFKTRPIVRGTWFWKGDDNDYQPYDEESATILEAAFQNKMFGKQNVNLSDGKKQRWVTQLSSGEFQQYRNAPNANAVGRPVQRGYKGAVETYQL